MERETLLQKEETQFHNLQSIFISIMGGGAYGVASSIISGILGEPKFHDEPASKKALISSSLVFGITIGALLTVLLTEYLGRRWIVIIAGIQSFIFQSILSMISHPTTIIVIRFISGIGLGSICTLTPIYCLELAQDKYKGRFVFLYQVSTTLGHNLGYLLNIIFNYVQSGWRYEFAISGIPVLIMGIGAIFCSESQAWKDKKLKEQQKLMKIKQLNHNNNTNNNTNPEDLLIQNEQNSLKEENNQAFLQSDVLIDHNEQQQTIETELTEEIEETKIQQIISSIKFLFTNYKRELIVGSSLAIFCQFTGINVVVYYTPQILEKAKMSKRISFLSVTLAIGVWNTLLTLPPLELIERYGRRTVLLIGSFVTTIGMLLIAIGYLVPKLVERDISYVLAIPGLIIFITGFEFGIGGVFYVLIAEMFPSKVAGVVSSLNMLIVWICADIIIALYQPLAKKISEGKVFIALTVINLLLFLFAIFVVRETKGKQLWKGKMEERKQIKIKQQQQQQEEEGQVRKESILE